MNVLFLSPSAGLGGAERMLLAMTGALHSHCPEMPLRVLALEQGPLIGLLETQGVAVDCVPLPPRLAELGDSQFALGVAADKLGLCVQAARALPELGRLIQRLRAHVHRVRPALIHSNGIKTHLLARLAGLDRIPLVWHVHDFYHARPLARRLLRWGLGGLRAAVAISAAVAADCRRVVVDRPVMVVPNAVETQRFRPCAVDAERLDRLAGLAPAPAGVLRVGLVATYARWKGHDVFLGAAAEVLRRQLPAPVRFYVIGGPVYQTHGSQFTSAELIGLSRALGLDGYLGLIGFLPDTSEIYPALDVVVHASTRPEPFGLTIVEAMACGRAVIATQAGGALELLAPGHDGLGVPLGDVTALAQAIGQLVTDSAMRARLGRSARATATSRFDSARLGPQLAEVYRYVLASSSKLRPALASASPILQLCH
jgi:glycosyltransferase involved in cell wall biosynthesis